MTFSENNLDIRWKQRFDNYLKVFQTLEAAVKLARERELSDLETQGLIQRFEYTHQLAWTVFKDFLQEKGIMDLIGSKDATRAAFKNGLITDGEVWMDMIKARNLTSHTYSDELAQAVTAAIIGRFYPAFLTMTNRFTALYHRPDDVSCAMD